MVGASAPTLTQEIMSYYSRSYYTGTGAQTDWTISFDYLEQSHVQVYVDGVLKTITTDWSFHNASTVRFVSAPALDTIILIRRSTSPTSRIVDFEVPSSLNEEDLDNDSLQGFYLAQEAIDQANASVGDDPATGQLTAGGKRIVNVADPINDQDAATKAWVEELGVSEVAVAVASAAAASVSQIAAAASAVAAAGSASTASTQAGLATTAKTNAETAETNAETAETNAGVSASSASTSASTATTQAGIATTQAGLATTAKTAAELAETNAETAEANAEAAQAAAEAARDIALVAKVAGHLLHVREEQAANTAAGTFTSGADRTRVLNTVKTNEIAGASLASNQITLPAGTYRADISAPAYEVDAHRAFLYNVTDAATTLYGEAGWAGAAVNANTKVSIRGQFTIASAKVFEVRHRCQTTKVSYGLGSQTNFGIEVYTDAMIVKVA